MHRTYELGPAKVGIRTTSPTFGAWLDYALSPYLVSEGSDPHYSVVLPERSEELGRKLSILYAGTIPLVRTLDLATLGRVFLDELESLSFPHRDDAIYVNAGFACLGGRTALIPARLVHHLVRLRGQLERAGVTLSSTKTVAVDPGSGRVVPVRPTLNVPAGAVDRLAGLAPVDGGRGGLFVDRPLDVDVVCWLDDVDAALLEPMPPAAALHNLASEVTNLPVIGGAALGGLAVLVERARCYGLGGDDARDMIRAIAETLASGSAPAST